MRQTRERTNGIGRGHASHILRIAITQPCKRAGNLYQLGGSVSSRMQPGRRDIRCVSFKYQGLIRQLTGQPPYSKRPFKRHGSTEAKHTPLIKKCGGLLRATVERMRNAGPDARQPEMLQHLVLGMTNVKDDGQIELASQLQLRRQETRLTLAIESGHKVIESNLTHRDQRWVIAMRQERRAQVIEVFFSCPVNQHRVDAQCVHQTSVCPAQGAQGLKSPHLHRRQHHHPHTSQLGVADHRFAVAAKFRCIKMTMRIDEHGRALNLVRTAFRR